MTNDESILVTGAAGQLGAVGRTVTGLLLERGLKVRAMVRRDDDRAAALRTAGAEVVIGGNCSNPLTSFGSSAVVVESTSACPFGRVPGGNRDHGGRRPRNRGGRPG